MKLSDKDLNSYVNEDDAVLITRLRDGEEKIEGFLLDKYKVLVRSKANTMFMLGAERDDLIQEGMIGLVKAMRDYDAGRDASFATFAELCITRMMYNAVSSSTRKKHMPLNCYVSFYSETGNDEDMKKRELSEVLGNEGDNPENIVIANENVERIEQLIETELSDFERQTLELSMTGIKYTEIAGILGKDEKSTDNALQRARQKLKKALKNK